MTVCDGLVMFGATGDLARHKLFAALYELAAADSGFGTVVGVGRSDWSDHDLRDAAEQAIRSTHDVDVDEGALRRLFDGMSYVRGATGDDETFHRIADRLSSCDVPLAYLGLPPSLFAETVAGLAATDLADRARLLVEKPFGLDLADAVELSDVLTDHVPEDRIHRIDHFLTKESIQDLLVLRFANRLLEPAWNREHVAAVRVVMSEESDAAERGGFYDGVGAIRDVLQNHLLQLVAAVAMEPPDGEGDDALRDARTTLLGAIEPIEPDDVDLGQYDGYRETAGVSDESTTETFVRTRLRIATDRWRGVPWTIETGKALASTATVVEVRFRPLPANALTRRRDAAASPAPANRVLIELKPEPRVRLVLQARSDDLELTTRSVSTDLHATTGPPRFDAYARLFDAARRGDRSPFAGRDEVEAAWAVVDPLVHAGRSPVIYARGTDVADVVPR